MCHLTRILSQWISVIIVIATFPSCGTQSKICEGKQENENTGTGNLINLITQNDSFIKVQTDNTVLTNEQKVEKLNNEQPNNKICCRYDHLRSNLVKTSFLELCSVTCKDNTDTLNH